MVVLCLNKSVVTMFSLCGTMFFSVERGTSQSSRQTCRCVSTWNVCKEMLLVLTFQSLHEAVAELADGPEAAAAQHLLLPLGLVRGSLTQLSGSGGGRGAAPPPGQFLLLSRILSSEREFFGVFSSIFLLFVGVYFKY